MAKPKEEVTDLQEETFDDEIDMVPRPRKSGNTLPAGDYYYRVSAVSRKGEPTTAVLSGAVTVAIAPFRRGP